MGYILLIEPLNTKPNLQYLLHILQKWIWITGLFGRTVPLSSWICACTLDVIYFLSIMDGAALLKPMMKGSFQ